MKSSSAPRWATSTYAFFFCRPSVLWRCTELSAHLQEAQKKFNKTSDDYDAALLKYLGRKSNHPLNSINEVR